MGFHHFDGLGHCLGGNENAREGNLLIGETITHLAHSRCEAFIDDFYGVYSLFNDFVGDFHRSILVTIQNSLNRLFYKFFLTHWLTSFLSRDS